MDSLHDRVALFLRFSVFKFLLKFEANRVEQIYPDFREVPDVCSLSLFLPLYLMEHNPLMSSSILCCKMKSQAQDNSASLEIIKTLSSMYVSFKKKKKSAYI